jgi:hypothetical protein
MRMLTVSEPFLLLENFGKWSNGVQSKLDNVSAPVLTLAHWSGDSVALGGIFDKAGGVNGTSRVALWTGRSFKPLGDGLNVPSIAALVSFDGMLIAGGNFSARSSMKRDGALFVFSLFLTDHFIIDTDGKHFLSSWNGKEWKTVDNVTFDGPVTCLAATNVTMYVGGTFKTATVNSRAIDNSNYLVQFDNGKCT